MFQAHFVPSLSALACLQTLGVLTAFAAHRSAGTPLQSCCQLLSLVFMSVAGFAGLIGSESAPARALVCGTLFACMVLTATFDRCGLGLRPLDTQD